jgi:ArsR family transcriptional regulator
MEPTLVPQELFEKVARRFRILGEPVRLQLLNLLHANGEMNVQQLVEATGHLQANVSKHLRVMAEESLVMRRKDGLFVYYAISDQSISGLCLLVCGQLQRGSSNLN